MRRFAALLLLGMSLNASGPARAGEEVEDVEFAFAWRASAAGPGAWVGKWVLGRGHCPGAAPTIQPCPGDQDGEQGTFHRPSPEVPRAAFDRHLRAAAMRDADAWIAETASFAPALASWMSQADVAPYLDEMHEQATAYARAPFAKP